MNLPLLWRDDNDEDDGVGGVLDFISDDSQPST